MQVRERMARIEAEMTAAERKLCTALLLDYPFAGLDTIQALAEKTRTSCPTISRFVAKLGFSGYQEFQRQLIEELKESRRSPLELHRGDRPLMGGYLEDFAARAGRLVADAASMVTPAQFDRVTGALADPKRRVHVIGGRMSDALARYFARHMAQMRAGVVHLPPDPEAWPDHLLSMRARDILFVIDFRRYQPSLLDLACRASKGPGARIYLMTDKGMSPVARHAGEVIATPIDSGTLWDSYAGALVLLEAMVTRIAEDNRDSARRRIEAWDALRPDTGKPQGDTA